MQIKMWNYPVSVSFHGVGVIQNSPYRIREDLKSDGSQSPFQRADGTFMGNIKLTLPYALHQLLQGKAPLQVVSQGHPAREFTWLDYIEETETYIYDCLFPYEGGQNLSIMYERICFATWQVDSSGVILVEKELSSN